MQGFCLSFLTQLDSSSHPAVQSLIKQHLLGHVNAASMLKQPLPMPQDSGKYSNFEGFWIAMGTKEPFLSTEYVLTASVKANLKDLGRVVSARYFSFLLDLGNCVLSVADPNIFLILLVLGGPRDLKVYLQVLGRGTPKKIRMECAAHFPKPCPCYVQNLRFSLFYIP